MVVDIVVLVLVVAAVAAAVAAAGIATVVVAGAVATKKYDYYDNALQSKPKLVPHTHPKTRDSTNLDDDMSRCYYHWISALAKHVCRMLHSRGALPTRTHVPHRR